MKRVNLIKVTKYIIFPFFFPLFHYSERPSGRSYILQTTFPVKELKDNDESLKDAGLLNSVVVQRYQ